MQPPRNPPESSFKIDEEGDRYIELNGERIYYDKNKWNYWKDEHNNLYSYNDDDKIYWFMWDLRHPKEVKYAIQIEAPIEEQNITKIMPAPKIITPDIRPPPTKTNLPLVSEQQHAQTIHIIAAPPAEVATAVKTVEKHIQTELSMGRLINMSDIEKSVREYPQYKEQILTSVIGEMVKFKATKNDIEKLQQMYDTSSYINKNFEVLSKKSTFEKIK